MVLLHNVMSYVEDASVAVEAATHSLKPSGISNCMTLELIPMVENWMKPLDVPEDFDPSQPDGRPRNP